MKKLIVATAAALLLAGCGTKNTAEPSEKYPETRVTFTADLPDGREVLCIFAKAGYGGGLSCDWDNAR